MRPDGPEGVRHPDERKRVRMYRRDDGMKLGKEGWIVGISYGASRC